MTFRNFQYLETPNMRYPYQGPHRAPHYLTPDVNVTASDGTSRTLAALHMWR